MGFESYRQGAFTKRLADLPDQPNMQAAELKTYFDSSPEELRQALNRLCDALGGLHRECGRAGADRSGRDRKRTETGARRIGGQAAERLRGRRQAGAGRAQPPYRD